MAEKHDISIQLDTETDLHFKQTKFIREKCDNPEYCNSSAKLYSVNPDQTVSIRSPYFIFCTHDTVGLYQLPCTVSRVIRQKDTLSREH